MSNKDHNYTDDGSTLAEDEMKHSFLVRVWRFLEDHLTVILLAFLPCWVVFYIVLFSILKILPEKLSEMENITDMHMACAAWALLPTTSVVWLPVCSTATGNSTSSRGIAVPGNSSSKRLVVWYAAFAKTAMYRLLPATKPS